MELIIRNLNVSFGEKKILQNIDAVFKEGKFHSIIGVNGSGKSVFLKAISNIIKYKGDILIKDQGNISNIARDSLSYVPQLNSSESQLTVFETILLGMFRELSWRVTEQQIKTVDCIIEDMSLEGIKNKMYGTLSGGQKQMVMLAQALISKPKILLLDEPTSALDLKHQLRLFQVTQKYTKINNCISIIVLHDLNLVSRFSDTITLIDRGRILKQGKPEEVISKEVLENSYGVSLDISKSERGFYTIIPVNIL